MNAVNGTEEHNYNRRMEDLRFEERRQLPTQHIPKPDNGFEILKHIGTALLAMLPLGNAYMNIKEEVLKNSIVTKQIVADVKDLEDKLIDIRTKLTELQSADVVIRNDIDSNINMTASGLREVNKKLQGIGGNK